MEGLKLGDKVMCSGFMQRNNSKTTENNYSFIKKNSFEGIYIGTKTLYMKTSVKYRKVMFSDFPEGPLTNYDEYYGLVGTDGQKVAIVVSNDKHYFVPFNKIIKMRY